MALPLTLTRYWLPLTSTGLAMVMFCVSVVPLSCTTRPPLARLVASMASLKVTKKSTLSRLVSPPLETLVPRTMPVMVGATVSTRRLATAAAAPGLPTASV